LVASLAFYEKAGSMLRPLVEDECHKKTIFLLRSPDLWLGSFTSVNTKCWSNPCCCKASSFNMPFEMGENTRFHAITWVCFRRKVSELHAEFFIWANTESQNGHHRAL